MMRRVTEEEARERLRWLDPAPLSSPWGAGGYDVERWPDSVWLLHAMFERADIAESVDHLTHHDMFRGDLASGRRQPTVVNRVDMTENAIATGIPLGYTTTPAPPWLRVRWAELARRGGFELGAGMTAPPCDLWFPWSSWPARISPAPEGSLDELSLHALLSVLASHTSSADLENCSVFFCPWANHPDEPVTVYACHMDDVPGLTVERDKSPSNLWPADRSWFVYTDWDLMATRVSGSGELIAAIETDQDLETLRWQR